jgi:cell division protein FtsB
MKILSILKNKYLIVSVLFLVWVFFFAQYDLISQKNQKDELDAMEQKIEYLEKEVNILQQEKNLLKNDSITLEKYAREKYYMKKNNEDVFVFDTIQKNISKASK